MNRAKLLLAFSFNLVCFGARASAQGPVSACYWAGPVAKCHPPTGLYLDLGRTLELGNTAGNFVQLQAASPSATYTMTLPASQGAASTVLTNNGSGALSWAPPASSVTSVTGTTPITVTPTTGAAVVSLQTPLQGPYGGTGVSSSAVYPLSGTIATLPVSTASLSGSFVSSITASTGAVLSIAPTTGAAVLTASGNSGGVVAFTSPNGLTSSNTLTANGVLYGGGAGFTPGATAAGSTGGLLYSTTSAAPAWLSVGSNGQVLMASSGATQGLAWATPASSGGTVTSVNYTPPSGGMFSAAGVPITTSGTIIESVTGTSGGVPYFSSPNAITSSAVLASNQVVVGGGVSGAPKTITAGATGSAVYWTGSGVSEGAISLASGSAAITGTLGTGNGGTGGPGSANQVLITTTGGAVAWGQVNLASSSAVIPKSPTQTIFNSGTSQTYTVPAGVVWLRVRMMGGGAGGGGSGPAATGTSGAGGTTTFGTSFLVAGGASAASSNSSSSGGTNSIGSGATGVQYTGSNGGAGAGNSNSATIFLSGGNGGVSPLGGAGMGSIGGSGSAGSAAMGNTGSGGGGGSTGNGGVGTYAGQGGGAGGYVDVIIPAPLSSYTYTVGGGGSGGSAGTNGTNGGAGAAGVIIIEEHYY